MLLGPSMFLTCSKLDQKKRKRQDQECRPLRSLIQDLENYFCVGYCGCVQRAFVLYIEDIYFGTILYFGNLVFLYVIFNLDGLYLVCMDLYDIWNMMLQVKVFE